MTNELVTAKCGHEVSASLSADGQFLHVPDCCELCDNELDLGTMEPEKSGDQLLTDAIRHLRRTHMNCYSWTMTVSDEEAIDILSTALATWSPNGCTWNPPLLVRG